LAQNFKNAIFAPIDNFKQADKPKREWWDAFLKLMQSKHQFLAKLAC
jgi:hypothetical protein